MNAIVHSTNVAIANGHPGRREWRRTIVTTNPMTPMTTATINAVATAVKALSALQLSGGQWSRNASENNPKTAAATPRIEVRMRATIEIARSGPDTGGFVGPVNGDAGWPMSGMLSLGTHGGYEVAE
jgi:hypothetical protein